MNQLSSLFISLLYTNPPKLIVCGMRSREGEYNPLSKRKGNLIDRLIGCHGKSNQQGSELVTSRKGKKRQKDEI